MQTAVARASIPYCNYEWATKHVIQKKKQEKTLAIRRGRDAQLPWFCGSRAYLSVNKVNDSGLTMLFLERQVKEGGHSVGVRFYSVLLINFNGSFCTRHC